MMGNRKRKMPTMLEAALKDVAARIFQSEVDEIVGEHDRVRRAQEDVEKNVEERRNSIRSGARRTAVRFRL